METVLVSVTIIKVEQGWKAHMRYMDRFLDRDIACDSRYMLDKKIDYLLRKALQTW